MEFKADTPGAYRVRAMPKLDGKAVMSQPRSFFMKTFSPESCPRPANFEILQVFSCANGASYSETHESLKSAMTNFNLNAKEDSISVFQTLWNNWPALVIACSSSQPPCSPAANAQSRKTRFSRFGVA
jgi:hypothetical protein